ncbi:MAG TPA: hypothetical protein VGK42_01755 [Candidatus Dormibacteraeota bacterium]
MAARRTSTPPRGSVERELREAAQQPEFWKEHIHPDDRSWSAS